MTFDTTEKSEFFQPVELYTFTRGVFSWYYTSADANIDFNGNTYVATPIKRSRIEATPDLGRITLKITTSRTTAFVDQFIETSPTDIITITVTRFHPEDSTSAITFKGRVINVKFQENDAEISCQPIQTTLKRPGLRRLYQLNCPHVLYGPECGVALGTHQVMGVITGVSGLTITSASFIISINPTFDAAHFTGGFVAFSQAGLVTKRFITDHNNGTGTLTLNLPFSGIIVGDTVTAAPGCDHVTPTCAGKFAVIENFGGFPFIPQKNPMSGTPVF